MSFHGAQHKGAARDRKELKQTQAEARNAETLPERRRAARLEVADD
ncbi:MAG TPA: hypothetical protein PLQ54_02585 [Armatimonadota bacterium]|nr:hypothetical protein [Armatimonadota bacterium]